MEDFKCFSKASPGTYKHQLYIEISSNTILLNLHMAFVDNIYLILDVVVIIIWLH